MPKAALSEAEHMQDMVGLTMRCRHAPCARLAGQGLRALCAHRVHIYAGMSSRSAYAGLWVMCWRVDSMIGACFHPLSADLQMEGLCCYWREATTSRASQRVSATRSKPSSEARLCTKLTAAHLLSRTRRLMRSFRRWWQFTSWRADFSWSLPLFATFSQPWAGVERGIKTTHRSLYSISQGSHF